jgi:hypothetical protein
MATRNRLSLAAEAAEDISAGGVKSTSSVAQAAQDACRRRDRIKLLLTSMTEQTNKVVANGAR